MANEGKSTATAAKPAIFVVGQWVSPETLPAEKSKDGAEHKSPMRAILLLDPSKIKTTLELAAGIAQLIDGMNAATKDGVLVTPSGNVPFKAKPEGKQVDGAAGDKSLADGTMDVTALVHCVNREVRLCHTRPMAAKYIEPHRKPV